MEKLRILLAGMVLLMGLSAETRAEDNPFDKGVDVTIGRDQTWQIKDKTATRSGSDSDNFYHLSYDRKQLRLRITSGAEDSEATARQYQQFAVEDIKIDGQQLPLFQWCLANQARHSRYLQQGLKVKQDVCSNIGEQGTFIMRLNIATLEALQKGRTLSIKIKPFRSSINLNFDISDFSEAAARLQDKVVVVKKAPAPVVPIVAEKKVVTPKTCKAVAPREFTKIKPVDYACGDVAAKTAAEASIAAVVAKERELAAENERKQKAAAEAKKAKELADKKLQEEQLAIEQARLAEAEAAKLEINNEITNKMLAVCMKKWEKGESRCYCEKFLEHAPAGIVADPACTAGE